MSEEHVKLKENKGVCFKTTLSNRPKCTHKLLLCPLKVSAANSNSLSFHQAAIFKLKIQYAVCVFPEGAGVARWPRTSNGSTTKELKYVQRCK